MKKAKHFLQALGIIVFLGVAYASFWVLVALFVAFIIYNVLQAFTGEED